MTKPIVAIVGRPNVGKSTLFNRLAGNRIAIVEGLPGTTRDRVYADTSWAEHDLTLIDTGGLELRPDSDLRQRVKDQAQIAIEEADVIILMVDVRDGVTHPDLEIAELLRRSQKPVILAVNKADNQRYQDEAVGFYELGIDDPIPVSAYHDIGIGDLLDRVMSNLPAPSPSIEDEGVMKIAIVGRPNAGKSMLLNAILGQERVIVDDHPGTTRDAVDTVFEYNGETMLLIDTAGIRRRGRIQPGVERYSVLRALRAIGRADVVLLVLDAAEPITAQDTHIAGYIQQALKGMVLVVNKWDLATQLGKEAGQCTKDIQRQFKFSSYAPILFVSAKFGRGVDRILAEARRVCQGRLKRLPTSLVNKVVSEAVATHAPPKAGPKRLRLFYATQTDVNPPTFVFSVNDPQLVHFSYERFLENKLRDAFGFAGTPLRLVFKRKGKD